MLKGWFKFSHRTHHHGSSIAEKWPKSIGYLGDFFSLVVDKKASGWLFT